MQAFGYGNFPHTEQTEELRELESQYAKVWFVVKPAECASMRRPSS